MSKGDDLCCCCCCLISGVLMAVLAEEADDLWLSMLEVVEEAEGESGPTTPAPAVLLAASMGLLSGDTALEPKLEEEDVVEGEGLRTPPPGAPFLRMDAIVSEMVCLAACLARSVLTNELTRSLRLPFTSGVANSSRGSTDERADAPAACCCGLLMGTVLEGRVADLCCDDDRSDDDISEGEEGLEEEEGAGAELDCPSG